MMRRMSADVIRASALEQARLVREGAISSEELARLYLQRIEQLNPRLNAFVDVFRRRARPSMACPWASRI
jgi:Asp-tRNA(Asn)/Glu-tRNA(Gln) amidotransferase A subunit family amidase